MNARTWRAGRQFYKRVSGPVEAGDLIVRASELSRAGGKTPVPGYCPDRSAVNFPMIEGASGVALIDQVALSYLLAPLQPLRRAGISELPPFDPFAKITVRLNAKTPQWLRARLGALKDMPFEADGVVHGDFHCGQMILDESGNLWLVDLDDMAQGPVEVDLGNFAAHLATRPETRRRRLAEGLPFWAEQVQKAWDELGEVCNPTLFRRHVDIAVIRRALKLHDARGDSEIMAALEHLPLLSR
ncbi:phosphotransferase family protein [Denitrobaculum tricleocarpae]|uniref:Phosphotransferase n=1 Tax=Denitrobaculum tricleocarpae TaxID=2591009 RepID=A0A545U1I0_9PROT|nr:phosphotransferase [Denitrobaculum tricleocarpae]TQV83330.1 phosphotransferase [Denitrobaculum tricleocarpae]